jgi:hypothetical protein
MMNLKGFGRKRSWTNRGTIPLLYWRGTKTTKNLRIVDVPIRTEHLPNMSQDYYRYTDVLALQHIVGMKVVNVTVRLIYGMLILHMCVICLIMHRIVPLYMINNYSIACVYRDYLKVKEFRP